MKVVLVLLLLPVMLFAQEKKNEEGLLNRLFAPGPLMLGHKDLEGGDCLKCHDTGKGVPDQKCLDCHKEIRPYVEQKTGFHGLVGKACIECHSDHKGRDYDSALLDEAKFDHALTGYKLLGKHTDLKCSECHKKNRSEKSVRPRDTRYFGESSSCMDCHRKDDIHFFKGNWQKKDCNTCHNEISWNKNTKFDHAKDAKYRLEGKHAKLKCQDCHNVGKQKKVTKYDWPSLKKDQCLSCHKDIHGDNLGMKFQGGKCNQCHNQNEWPIKKFDHRVTKYPLRGKHAEIRCTECHTQTKLALKQGSKKFKWHGLKQDCLSCHDDFHFYGNHQSKRFKEPNNCIECHDEKAWKPAHSFNHNSETRFPVTGKHSKVKCNDCHTTIYNKAKNSPRHYYWKNLETKTCENCHKNPHTKTFSKQFLAKRCTECHVTEGWKLSPRKTSKNFDHSKTRFALTGKHSKIECAECHVQKGQQVFKFESFEKQFCSDCHANPHSKQFGRKFNDQSCAECHLTASFIRIKKFDHAKTDFDLKGKHKKLNCFACHVSDKSINTNVKKKRKGYWHQFRFPDLKQDSCVTCHSDFHSGQLGKDCAKCHSELAWKKPKFDHNKDSDFVLRGEHQKAKCNDCHKPINGENIRFGKPAKAFKVIRYKPISTACIDCHKRDDVHKGSFGARCNQCHVESGWKRTKDFHKNFTLHGVHYTLDCNECHFDGKKLAGMSDACFVCHQKDDIHSGQLPNCTECHRQSFWEHTSFRHSMTNFPLRGTHRTLDCFSCHANGIYQGTPSDCIDCHLGDANAVTTPPHIQPAFQECRDCHNQFTF